MRPKMTAVQVHDFFDGYARAFANGDIDGICARWDYPALLVFEGQQVSLGKPSVAMPSASAPSIPPRAWRTLRRISSASYH
jgi:hypothetical protein